MPRLAWRKSALTVLIALVGQLLMPTLVWATDRDFDTVLSGLPLLPEKANEPFDSIDGVDGNAESPFARENKYFRMPLRQFLNLMAKPEGINVTLVPMNLNAATLNRPLGVILRNLTKGEALSLVLQIFELKAVQFNERTIIIMQAKENKEFGLKTRKIYRLTHTTPKKVKEFITNSKALKAIINPDNVIPNEDGQSILAIDTERNIALIDSVVSLVDQKPNKIEGRIPLSFLTGQEFLAAINQLGPDVTTRVNSKALYYSEKGRAMISYDTPDNIEFLRALAKKVDLPARQVLIDTSIMTVGSTFTREIGFKMDTTSLTVDSLDRLLNNNRLARHLATTKQLPAAARITYLLTKTGAQTLASPKIRTLDGERANITIGDIIVVRIVSQTQQQAVTGQANVSQNVTPQEITTGVQLSVKPTIHHDKTVTLELTVSNETPTQIKDFGVDRSTTNSTSKLRVKDAETVILGGFINRKEDQDKTPIPFLGEVPILRSIFNANRRNKVNSELVLLITPYILEYFTNPRTGEAELPRLAGKGEDPDQPGPEASPSPPEPEKADREPILRSPQGQPLVKNIYDKEKGSIILRKRSEAERLAAEDKPTISPTGDSVTLSRMDVDGPVIDRANPVATFRPTPRPVGADNPVVAAPPVAEVKPAGPPMSNVDAAKEAALGALGEQPLPLKSLGAVESKQVLDNFAKTVADTAEWKDGVVASRASKAPEKIQDYGVLGRLSDKVSDAESFGKQLDEIKTRDAAAAAADAVHAAPPAPSSGDEARAAVAKMRQESAALRARTENRESVDETPRPPAHGPRSSLFNVSPEDFGASPAPAVPATRPISVPSRATPSLAVREVLPPVKPARAPEFGGADEALAQIRANLAKTAKLEEDEDEEPVPLPVKRPLPAARPVASAAPLHLASSKASERVADLRAKAVEMQRVRDGVPAVKPVAAPPSFAAPIAGGAASSGAAKLMAGLNEPLRAPPPVVLPVTPRPVVSVPVDPPPSSALRGGLAVLRGADGANADIAEVERALQLPVKPAPAANLAARPSIAALRAKQVVARPSAPEPEDEPEEPAPKVVAKVEPKVAPKAEPDVDAMFANAAAAKPAPVVERGPVVNRFQQLVAARQAALVKTAPAPVQLLAAPKPVEREKGIELPAPKQAPVLVARPVVVEAPKPLGLPKPVAKPVVAAKPVEEDEDEEPAPVKVAKAPAPKPVEVGASGKLAPGKSKLDHLRNAVFEHHHAAPTQAIAARAAAAPAKLDAAVAAAQVKKAEAPLARASSQASTAVKRLDALAKAASTPVPHSPVTLRPREANTLGARGKVGPTLDELEGKLQAALHRGASKEHALAADARTHERVQATVNMLKGDETAARARLAKLAAEASAPRDIEEDLAPRRLASRDGSGIVVKKAAAQLAKIVPPDDSEDEVDAAPPGAPLSSFSKPAVAAAPRRDPKALPPELETDTPVALGDSDEAFNGKPLAVSLKSKRPVSTAQLKERLRALSAELADGPAKTSAPARTAKAPSTEDAGIGAAVVGGEDPIGSLARMASESGPKPVVKEHGYAAPNTIRVGDRVVPLDKTGRMTLKSNYPSGLSRLKKLANEGKPAPPPKPAAKAEAAPDEFDSLLGEAQKKLDSGL